MPAFGAVVVLVSHRFEVGIDQREESDKKYLICNADEGDPGAFMDRVYWKETP